MIADYRRLTILGNLPKKLPSIYQIIVPSVNHGSERCREIVKKLYEIRFPMESIKRRFLLTDDQFVSSGIDGIIMRDNLL
jgi:hypothetical protein